MKIKKSTIKQIKTATMVILIMLGIFGSVLMLTSNGIPAAASTDNVSIDLNGNQIVEVTARAGYQPALSEAKSGVPTTLRIKTQGTYDCSLALVIPKLGISKLLPSSGSTDFNIGIQTKGGVIDGTCSMGMYRFQIKFV